MQTTSYDAVVVGTGQAGPSLAARLAKEGRRVAIVERDRIGGTCVNTGCIPTKALVASARVAHLARRAADFGVEVGEVRVDFARVQARRARIAGESNRGLTEWLEGTEGVELVRGDARLEGRGRVRVGERILACDQVFLNVGARPRVPDLRGIDEVPWLTSSDMMELDSLPRHLVIVGAGSVALEYAQMMRRFGAEVTVVERGPRVFGKDDADVSEAIQEILAREGVAFRLEAECVGLERAGAEVAVALECAEGEPRVQGSHLLLAVGRVPNTDGLGLETVGAETDERGYVKVDGALRTSAPGVWALGDCNGRGAFTHTSYDDYEIVAANLLDGEARSVDDRIPCFGLFVDPPLGRVGMTQAEARASGRRVLVGKRPMTKVGRARERGETEGFLEVLVDADSEEILGAALLGIGADEVVHVLLTAMAAGASYRTIARSMHIHPTVAELLPTLLQDLEPLEPA